jgi:hypothetical protein
MTLKITYALASLAHLVGAASGIAAIIFGQSLVFVLLGSALTSLNASLVGRCLARYLAQK